jgi:hypothetical protein
MNLARTSARVSALTLLAALAFAGEARAQQHGSVPGFLPSTQGLHFSNAWPNEPDYTVTTPLFSIPIGNASQGLCGGMVFTVRDFFQAGVCTPLNTANPVDEGPLFNYIFDRLIDSFNLQLGVNSSVMRYYELETFTTSDAGRAQAIVEEWPGIKGDLDGGTLSPLGLVRVHSDADPTKLGEDHQVLAYAYELAGTVATIHIYDPNHPNDDTQTLTVDTSTGVNPIDSDGSPLFSFFRTPYTPCTATPSQAVNWSNGFEGTDAGAWWFTGNAGVDVGLGLSRTGANDGWVRAPSGWNAVNTSIPAATGATCTVGAWLRTTAVVDGYMSIRSWNGAILDEVHLTGSPDGTYDFHTFNFLADGSSVLFYVGLWGDGSDTWIQVDDVSSTCDVWQ